MKDDDWRAIDEGHEVKISFAEEHIFVTDSEDQTISWNVKDAECHC